MDGIQVLRERHATRAKEVRELVEKNNDKWTAEHQTKYDEFMKELDDIKAAADRFQRMMEATTETAIQAAAGEVADRAERDGHAKTPMAKLFVKWLRGGDRALSAQEWTDIRATLSTTTGSEGGFTVQTEVARTLMDALKAYGGMRAVADVIQTTGFGDLNYPTSDGTSETGEQIAQNTTANALDPSFGVVTISPYKYSSKIVAVPFELLQDSNIDIEAFVRTRLTQRIGRITNTKFTIGTGTAEPRGIVTASSVGKTGTTGQTVTVIFDDLVDLIHSVDPAYRELGRCRFMMNDSSLKVIRKLKDSQGRPIFLPGYDGLTGAMPDAVLGYPTTTNQDVAAMAANAKSILFGDFNYYVIRDVMAANLFRFEDSAYVKLGQIGFLMWSRHGGNFTDVGGAVKHYANSAT
jgi:HK97 family phage major capsid protein